MLVEIKGRARISRWEPAEFAMTRSVPTASMMSAARAGVHFVVG